MRRRFRYSPQLGRLVELCGEEIDNPSGPLIVGDLPAYESPIDGRVISGRAARREDLKRSGCREYDPGMREQMARNQAADDAKLDADVGRTVEKFFHETTPRNRELLVQALQAGLDPRTIRK